ncbi:Mob1/phocein family protein [Aphelenchoides bicaudatus]|nr:Mob1/phocein family protein [Aphelenchoides bicaudatus]
MGAKVGVSEHPTATTSTSAGLQPPNQSEPKRFERIRSSLDYWRKSFFGGCNFIKIKAQNSRSRRKNEVNKENRNNTATGANQPVSLKKAGVASSSHSSSTKQRKTPENCVAYTIDDAMIDKLTEVPAGIDKNEWLAMHTLDLFENISSLCGVVLDHCTPITCGSMSFPGCQKAYWLDEKGKRHQYSAGRYIDCVMSFIEAAKKEAIFPTKYGMPFPTDFEQYCRRIVKFLWHCCGHLYSKHWDLMALLNLRPQYGLVLAHLAAIAKQYVLLDSKEMNSLTNTLYLVRPPCLQAPSSQAKWRRCAVANHTTNSASWSRMPASKSGSWGGQSTTASSIASSTVATMPALNNNNMGKQAALMHSSPYAQTC